MELIFQKKNFPTSPGGDRYEWTEAETTFSVPKKAKILIEVTASARNASQNHASDDDDLRIALDGYEFGKYEIHDEKISWKGFGTASSWDGASLKGMSKTIYFFVELQNGDHTIQFYADETPTLSEINVYQLDSSGLFKIQDKAPSNVIDVDKKGIPWLSFLFLGTKPKRFSITSIVRSAKQKFESDGDNLKVIINGKIRHNEKAPTSRKYKNFFFSGDLNKGRLETLELKPSDFDLFEDSVELWVDENPRTTINLELFDGLNEWLDKGIPERIKLRLYDAMIKRLIRAFTVLRYEHAGRFLHHSCSPNPSKLVFDNNSSLVKKIKSDEAYENIAKIVKQQIREGHLEGEVHLGDERQDLNVNFRQGDLKYSLHGIKKLTYKAEPVGEGQYELQISLFDVYDFATETYHTSPVWLPIHIADVLEKNHLLNNFEVEIKILDTIKTLS